MFKPISELTTKVTKHHHKAIIRIFKVLKSKNQRFLKAVVTFFIYIITLNKRFNSSFVPFVVK
ncbi:MAG: hypothetical protein DI622_11785 [Chryseobacterium sp.]|nr:MAG: hypothetical protein DI622_11785 [Chryseobacterium sp.]